ncbi:purine-nucleoside phosphorylase [Candidatus Woesearchaeota archaeon CG10_big_fil_rev_8_21_14_0_10_45_16]|nr:MAG: purine-nucleoside phosphorylase [Candidatus Woesearchaeota archaeon CG10_big_fil_rev_8_21_14_0_10_45_16]
MPTNIMSLERLQKALDFQAFYEQKVAQAADYIKERLSGLKPAFGVVLGSGLGELAGSIEGAVTIPYSDIPNFPMTTVPGHEGTMFIGTLEGVPVVGMKGRKHFYEVADGPLNTGMLLTVFPVHVLASLGVENYFVTNASGGLNPNYKVGDVMIITSHINHMPNPLLGRHHDFKRVGSQDQVWRFQPMNGAYDKELTSLLRDAGFSHDSHVHEGTYMAVTGPTYEAEAEAIAFRDGFKADAVGMSTTPEVIIARNRGMKAVGFSCITNVVTEDGINATSHEEVKAVLESSEVKNRLTSIVRKFFRSYQEENS